MNDPIKPKKTEERIENLELNKETIQELTEGEAEQVGGGINPRWSAENCTLITCGG